MTTAPTLSEAEHIAKKLKELASNFSTPSPARGTCNGAIQELRRLQTENERLRGDYAIRGAQIQRMAALIDELESKIGRFQGVPLSLIESINAATGSNEWQGDHSPAELLEPACSAITALRAERPMPTVEDASQEWGKVDPITAWHLIERHADNWADIGKMMTEYVQAQIARADLEARKPLPVSVERLGELWASQRSFHGGEPLKCGHVEFARLVEVEYGVLGRIPIREENGGQIDHSLIASREVVADGPVRVTRLHLTDEGCVGLTSQATGPLPGIKET